MSNAKIPCILIPLLLLFFTTNAQLIETVGNYYVEHFGEQEGLQNTIYSIFPDNDGFLWIATSNGIVRFNGNHILPITIKRTKYKNSYSSVSSLNCKKNDTVLAYSSFLEKTALILKDKIVGVRDLQIEETGLLFSNQKYPVKAPTYITGNNYTSEFGKKIKWDVSTYSLIGGTYNEDTIWIALTNGIGFFDKNGVINKINIPSFDVGKVISVGKHILYLDKSNHLNHYSAKGLQKRESVNIPMLHYLSIYNNRFGEGFYLVADSSLYKADISTSGKISLKKLIANLKCPTDISVVFEKDSNNIIAGTFKSGLYVYKKNSLNVTNPLPHGLPNTFFLQRLLPDSQTIFAGKGYLFKKGFQFDKKIKGYEKNYYGIMKDSKGNYWYGIENCILRTREIGIPADSVAHINGLYIKMLLEDKDGRKWISSESGFGYLENDRYTEVKVKEFSGRRINCMKQYATGKYIVGTEWGLFVWDNIHQPHPKEISAFKATHIRSIQFEADGSAFIFTYGNGFFLMVKDSAVSLSDNKEDLAFTHTLIEDERGYCWLPSNNGLFVTTKKSLIEYSKNRAHPPFFYMFSMKDGLRTNEFNGGTEPTYLRLPNGDLSLASMDGLVHFNPSKIHFLFSSSPILIDQVRLNNNEIDVTDSFNVDNEIKNIGLSISTAYWGNKENDVLEYQVKKTEATTDRGEWLPIDQSNEINFFSPGYGDYQLTIRKRTGLGTDDYLFKNISFHVLPKWYQTKASSLAIIFGILGMLIGIFFWRRSYYRRSNRILKEKVAIATLKLQQMNSTLEKKVEERAKSILEAEKKFRTLVEKSLVGVYIIQDNKFLYVNPRYEEIFGYDSGELYGVSPSYIIKENLRYATNKRIIQLTLGEIDSEHSETIGVKKDGTERLLEFYASRIMYEGKPTVIGTVLDITEKKLLEQKITEQKVQEQKKITRAILQGEEKERNKIGQELHDNINQILAGTKLYLSIIDQDKSNAKHIEHSMQLLDSAIEEIRELSKNKVTPPKKTSLQELLQTLHDNFYVATKIETHFSYEGSSQPIDEELKLNIYRIVQEQLNNIIKHAKAKNVSIIVSVNKNNITVQVTDDGKGFEVNCKKKGIGIANMTNRVESFNGTLNIESSPGKGCKIEINLPVNQSQPFIFYTYN